jgi:hypothetical protein
MPVHRDVCQLDESEARATAAWGAKTLIEATFR